MLDRRDGAIAHSIVELQARVTRLEREVFVPAPVVASSEAAEHPQG